MIWAMNRTSLGKSRIPGFHELQVAFCRPAVPQPPKVRGFDLASHQACANVTKECQRVNHKARGQPHSAPQTRARKGGPGLVAAAADDSAAGLDSGAVGDG